LLWSRSIRKFLIVAGCAFMVFAGVCRAENGGRTKNSSQKSPSRRTRTAVRHSRRHARLVYVAGRKKTTNKRRRSRRRRIRGQQKIDQHRARQIQEALIREHYLSGKPDGIWGSKTQKAMQRYQADNGWQTKTTPDARALIKLGLGPDREHLLNPESAMINSVDPNVPAPAKVNAKKTKAEAEHTVAAKDKPATTPVAAPAATVPAVDAPASGNPPAADPSPETKPQK
jgi:peptidoglycan hydrolase-like protein with peptidoglycan-binding domain